MLLCLLLIRLAVTPLLDWPRSDRHDDLHDFLAVETFRARQPGPPPVVLLLGSSRTMYGFEPDLMAESLGLEAGAVRLLAIPGSTPWDARVLLERNPHLARGAKVAVLDLQPYMFNSNYEYALPDRYSSLAGPGEALWLQGMDRVRALAQWVWPVHALRRPLRTWLQDAQLLASGESAIEETLGLPLWNERHPQHTETDEELAEAMGQEKFQARGWADVTFEAFSFSQRQAHHIHALIAELRREDVHVIVHHPPMHTGFYKRVEESAEARDALADYFALLETLREDGADVIIWRTPEEIGFSSDSLPDYGHFPKRMALRYGDLMSEYICNEGWIDCP